MTQQLEYPAPATEERWKPFFTEDSLATHFFRKLIHTYHGFNESLHGFEVLDGNHETEAFSGLTGTVMLRASDMSRGYVMTGVRNFGKIPLNVESRFKLTVDYRNRLRDIVLHNHPDLEVVHQFFDSELCRAGFYWRKK